MFQRLYIRKLKAFRSAPADIATLKAQLNIADLLGIETIAVYDLYEAPQAHFEQALRQVFADPVTDEVLEELPAANAIFVIEPLPGQFRRTMFGAFASRLCANDRPLRHCLSGQRTIEYGRARAS